MTRAPGLTVYGCEPDETDLFHELAPRFGVAPITTTGAAVSEHNVGSALGSRCISVGHRSEVRAGLLLALRDVGVEHLSTRSIGLDHIDLVAAGNAGITVENVVYAPDGVADFTVMLMLMALHNADAIVSSARRRDFRLPSARGRDLRDTTVGVVGVGNIGRAVISRLHGFGCRVLAYDIGGDAAPAVAAECVSLGELLRASDIVTLHLPLNAGTHHVIGRAQIAAMRPGAVLVNTGRGALVDTGALVVALESGVLGGAALDVLEGEEGLFSFDCANRPVDNPSLVKLLELPNAIVTPHTAYYTTRTLHDTVAGTLRRCVEFERSRISV